MKRYPLAPLADLMHLSENQALEKLKVGGSTGGTYRREGLSAAAAERLAERAGFHPFEVWPELRDDVLAGVERECANAGCGARFLPYRDGMHFHCSARCRDAASSRRFLARRREDPAFRERERARARAYRAEVRAARERRQARSA